MNDHGTQYAAGRVVVLMGVSGAGKSTVAALLRDRLGWPMLEGDDLHDPRSLSKMTAGEPLDDAERVPWLRAVRAWIDEALASGGSGVVTCSALRRSHRDLLRRPEVTFAHLHAERDVLERRLEERVGHVVGGTLLDSQLASLEALEPDERAFIVPLGPPAQQSEHVARRLQRVELGMIGLGRMGSNMARRIREHGNSVLGYDVSDATGRDVASLEELVQALEPPRIVWSMLPAGEPTREAIGQLAQHLDRGDLVVDGANSRYTDDPANAELLAARGIAYVDVGISGGVHGLREGYGVMAGGSEDDIARLMPVFAALAPPGGGFVHAGPVGAGHFAKMVHNGIEYGIMQAYGEGYELLGASELVADPDAVLAAWRHGTVVRSWLLDLLVKALTEDPHLASTPGYARDSGEGRWAVEAAVQHGVPVPVISAALFARFASRQEQSPAMQVVAALRTQFGGHASGPPTGGGDGKSPA